MFKTGLYAIPLILLSGLVYERHSQFVKAVRQVPERQVWGWMKKNAAPQDITAEPYLRGLADDLEEFHKQRQETAAEVAMVLAELRTGCIKLYYLYHDPLSEAQQKWITERILFWQEHFDVTLSDLLENKATPLQASHKATMVVVMIARELRGKAAEEAAR